MKPWMSLVIVVAGVVAGCSKPSKTESKAPEAKPAEAKVEPKVEPKPGTPAPSATDAGAVDAAADPTAALPGSHPANQIVNAAGAGPADCTPAAVKAARKEANALVKAGDFKGAMTRLSALTGGCSLDPGELEHPYLDFFWVYSDLAFAAYKAGDYAYCMQVLGPLTTPKPPYGVDNFELGDSKVSEALLHNEELCTKAHEQGFKAFAARACPLVKDDDEQGVALPAGALPAGARSGCLVLTGGADYDGFQKALEGDEGATDDDDKLCPQLVLRAGGKDRPLAVDEGPLVATSDCCNLADLTFAMVGGEPQVRIVGEGRDCFGGTAYTTLDAVYALKGDALVLRSSDGVVSH